MSKWQVWGLDVWGNAEDGWEVNDWWKLKVVDLPKNPSNKQVIQALFDAEILKTNNPRKFSIEWWDTKKCGINCVVEDMPLLNVERIEE